MNFYLRSTILLTGIVLSLTGCQKAAPLTKPTPNPVEKQPTETQKSVTYEGFNSLLKDGKPMQCRFSSSNGEMQQQGVVYTNGTQVKAEFELMDSNGVSTSSNMLSSGNLAYVWGDAYQQGMKIKLDQTTGALPTGLNEAQTPPELGALNDTNLTCDAWKVDEQTFELPSNVQFLDISEQMGRMMKQVPNSQDLCASCDSLEGTAKSQCQSALNCQ